MLIGNRWAESADGSTYDLVNPATGGNIGSVPNASVEDVDHAVAAARRTFDSGVWQGLDAAERQSTLHRCAEALRDIRRDLAVIMAEEGGKPVGEGLGEADQLASYFQYAAAATRSLTGRVAAHETRGAIGYTVQVPLGVVAAVTPYNFPLWTFGAKVAMGLAAGCSLVLKPAPATPLSSLRAAQALIDAGIPMGALNVVTTDSVATSRRLTEHPDVDGISFTGSTNVGSQIMRSAAETFKRLTLELGGKSPNIVFGDADLGAFEASFFSSIFMNSGQVCVAGSLLLVQREILDDVLERVVRIAVRTTAGDPLDPATEYGPLISSQHRDHVHGFVQRAAAEGVRVLAGGHPIEGPGFYYSPTVLLADAPSREACREEIFGPVVTVLPFTDEQDALRIANGTGFGLKAACWTKDAARLLRMVRDLRAGSVIGNAYRPPVPQAGLPFGGFGRSGMGRELGSEGILTGFMETKSIMVDMS